jgi:hypothetical protein
MVAVDHHHRTLTGKACVWQLTVGNLFMHINAWCSLSDTTDLSDVRLGIFPDWFNDADEEVYAAHTRTQHF